MVYVFASRSMKGTNGTTAVPSTSAAYCRSAKPLCPELAVAGALRRLPAIGADRIPPISGAGIGNRLPAAGRGGRAATLPTAGTVGAGVEEEGLEESAG